MLSNNYYQQYLRACQAGLPAEIVLGSPKSETCKDLGVCRIYLEGRPADRQPCGEPVSAYLRVDRQTGRLLVHFLECSINPAVRDAHFRDDRFRVTDGYRLDPSVVAALGLPAGNHRIYPGSYPVMDDEHLLTVSLRLGEAAVLSIPEQRLAA